MNMKTTVVRTQAKRQTACATLLVYGLDVHWRGRWWWVSFIHVHHCR